jgi:DNA-binding transcriptional LysR family regulator
MDMLLTGELDVAVGTTEHPGLRCERLYQNPLVLVHPHTMPEAEVPSTLADLAKRPVITFASGLTVRRLLEGAFERAGLPFQPVMELANVEVIKASSPTAACRTASSQPGRSPSARSPGSSA